MAFLTFQIKKYSFALLHVLTEWLEKCWMGPRFAKLQVNHIAKKKFTGFKANRQLANRDSHPSSFFTSSSVHDQSLQTLQL